MRHVAMAWMVAPLLLSAGCEKREADSGPAAVVELRPEPLTGNAKEFGLRLTRQFLKRDAAGVDVRFEIANDGRGIVQLVAAPSATGPEAALLVELFEGGAWTRSPTTAPPSKDFVDLWPGATDYGRARITADVHWVRVVVRAKGLTTADGISLGAGTTDLFSDAFELPAE
jgi:hypothetical protein